MIVWGGFLSSFVFPNDTDTGGRYDPVMDTWAPTSMAGAPVARHSHTAVWTGDEMIVWGGNGFGAETSGARYDPITDAWLPTSQVDVPSERSEHAAVWTGSEMIIWGGNYYFDGEDHYTNTGGRYGPATDTWVATSLADSPTPRAYHTAVWTGNRMIVWGGWDDTALDDGGQYDPGADSWMPTSVSEAPSPRSGHTATWTGNTMIVWGGNVQDTGGRYLPATDAWTPTSTAGAPQPRSLHSAVWTGSVMVAWGGRGGLDYSFLSTGGAYSVSPQAPTVRPALTVEKSGSAAVLLWSAVPGATGYDIVKGALGVLLASGGDFTSSTTACLADDLAATSVDDTELLPAGSGLWYLLRAVNCGGAGSYDEDVPGQQGSRDDEIDASANACP
jgi:hypothetical protein